MSISSGELKKAYERMQFAQSSLLMLREAQKDWRPIADHVLALLNIQKLWPKGWTQTHFIELQTELGLVDAAARLVEKEVQLAEKSVHEATSILNEAKVLERRGETPALLNGMTMEDVFEQHIANVQVRAENAVDVYREFHEHVTTVRGILGI